jgi:hypothetical protein
LSVSVGCTLSVRGSGAHGRIIATTERAARNGASIIRRASTRSASAWFQRLIARSTASVAST